MRQQLKEAQICGSYPHQSTSISPPPALSPTFPLPVLTPTAPPTPTQTQPTQLGTSSQDTDFQALLSGVLQQMTGTTQPGDRQGESSMTPFLILGATLDPKIKAMIWSHQYVQLGMLYSWVCCTAGCVVQLGVLYSWCVVQLDVLYSWVCCTAGCVVQLGMLYSWVCCTAGVLYSWMCCTAGCVVQLGVLYSWVCCTAGYVVQLGMLASNTEPSSSWMVTGQSHSHTS